MTESRYFSISQLSTLDSKKNLHLLIHGNVYDLHEFVNEHPGGDLVLVGEAGKDATKAFDDVQHSEDAKELMKDYLVGYCLEISQLDDGEITTKEKKLAASLESRFLLLFLSASLALLLGLYWKQYAAAASAVSGSF